MKFIFKFLSSCTCAMPRFCSLKGRGDIINRAFTGLCKTADRVNICWWEGILIILIWWKFCPSQQPCTVGATYSWNIHFCSLLPPPFRGRHTICLQFKKIFFTIPLLRSLMWCIGVQRNNIFELSRITLTTTTNPYLASLMTVNLMNQPTTSQQQFSKFIFCTRTGRRAIEVTKERDCVHHVEQSPEFVQSWISSSEFSHQSLGFRSSADYLSWRHFWLLEIWAKTCSTTHGSSSLPSLSLFIFPTKAIFSSPHNQ